jgi:hypothetical protein
MTPVTDHTDELLKSTQCWPGIQVHVTSDHDGADDSDRPKPCLADLAVISEQLHMIAKRCSYCRHNLKVFTVLVQ